MADIIVYPNAYLRKAGVKEDIVSNKTSLEFRGSPEKNLDPFDMKEAQQADSSWDVFGVQFDETEEGTYIGDNQDFEEMSYNSPLNYGSWTQEEGMVLFSDITPCIIRRTEGGEPVEVCELDYDLKTDLSTGEEHIMEVDEDICMRFPNMFYRLEKVGDILEIRVSPRFQFEGSTPMLGNLPQGYSNHSYIPYIYTEILRIMLFKKWRRDPLPSKINQEILECGHEDGDAMFSRDLFSYKKPKILGLESYWGDDAMTLDPFITSSEGNRLSSNDDPSPEGAGGNRDDGYDDLDLYNINSRPEAITRARTVARVGQYMYIGIYPGIEDAEGNIRSLREMASVPGVDPAKIFYRESIGEIEDSIPEVINQVRIDDNQIVLEKLDWRNGRIQVEPEGSIFNAKDCQLVYNGSWRRRIFERT